MAGVLLQKLGELGFRTAVGQRAGGREVGNQHLLGGIENLGGFSHKMHACKEDDVGIGGGCLPRKGETVADKISDFLHLGTGVIMGQNDGVFLLFQLVDAFFHWGWNNQKFRCKITT